MTEKGQTQYSSKNRFCVRLIRVIWVVVVIVNAVYGSSAYAQNAPSGNVDELNNLRIAQALEQAGEYEKALDFYQKLYQISPDNFVYFDGLRRTYMNLKKYDEAKELLTAKLKTDPSNVVLMCELGDVYFKDSKQDSAMVEWNKAIDADPKNPNTYRAVAGTIADERLFDDAIDVLRKGETNSKAIFSNEISRLYFLNANYGASLHELLKQLQPPQPPYVLANIEGQIGAFSSSKAALDQYTAEMEKEVATKPNDPNYRTLLGFLYMEKRNYPGAYSEYKWLDQHSSSPGSELMEFAARAYNEEAYDVAASAYNEVAGLSKNNSIVAQALFGNANSLRMMGEKNYAEDDFPCSTTDSLRQLSYAVSGYEKILEQYSGAPFLSTVVFNLVELKMRYFHDFSGAERMISDYSNRIQPSLDDWALLRIRLYMMEGKFQEAFSTALGVLQSSSSSIKRPPLPDEPVGNSYDEVEFQAATALYYLGLYDSSVFYLKEIVANPMSDAANDAIQLLNTISDNRGNPSALREFATASALEESNQIPQGAATLEKLLNDYPNAQLADHARFNLASDYCKMGNVGAALKNYSILDQDSTAIFADRADFRICRIYQQTLHQNEKAIAGYENFLVRFPNSIYQDKVREILRDLLGENS